MKLNTIIQKYALWVADHLWPITSIYCRAPYTLVFKTTNWCWYNCKHCCECSGPNQPREYIPAPVIKSYLNQAIQDPKFTRNVVFTGGEIMSAYRFGPENYVPDLLNHSLSLGIGTDIKTNGAWIHAGFGRKIINDLAAAANANKPYTLQVSLSADKYHKNALKNNTDIILELAKTRAPLGVHMSSFVGEHGISNAIIEQVRASGMPVQEMFCIINDDNVRLDYKINNSLILWTSAGHLFDGGRAKNIPGALHTEYPQFSFMTADGTALIALDSFGRTTLGEASGRKISTKWNTKRGAKSLNHIRKGLYDSTTIEEIRTYIPMALKSLFRTR